MHLKAHNIPLPDFLDTPTLEAAMHAGETFGYPFMLKNKKLAYDGRGNAVVDSVESLPAAFAKLGSKVLSLMEKVIDIFMRRSFLS